MTIPRKNMMVKKCYFLGNTLSMYFMNLFVYTIKEAEGIEIIIEALH